MTGAGRCRRRVVRGAFATALFPQLAALALRHRSLGTAGTSGRVSSSSPAPEARPAVLRPSRTNPCPPSRRPGSSRCVCRALAPLPPIPHVAAAARRSLRPLALADSPALGRTRTPGIDRSAPTLRSRRAPLVEQHAGGRAGILPAVLAPHRRPQRCWMSTGASLGGALGLSSPSIFCRQIGVSATFGALPTSRITPRSLPAGGTTTLATSVGSFPLRPTKSVTSGSSPPLRGWCRLPIWCRRSSVRSVRSRRSGRKSRVSVVSRPRGGWW